MPFCTSRSILIHLNGILMFYVSEIPYSTTVTDFIFHHKNDTLRSNHPWSTRIYNTTRLKSLLAAPVSTRGQDKASLACRKIRLNETNQLTAMPTRRGFTFISCRVSYNCYPPHNFHFQMNHRRYKTCVVLGRHNTHKTTMNQSQCTKTGYSAPFVIFQCIFLTHN